MITRRQFTLAGLAAGVGAMLGIRRKQMPVRYGLIEAGKGYMGRVASIRISLNGNEFRDGAPVYMRSGRVNDVEGWVEMFDIEPCKESSCGFRLLDNPPRRYYGNVLVWEV